MPMLMPAYVQMGIQAHLMTSKSVRTYRKIYIYLYTYSLAVNTIFGKSRVWANKLPSMRRVRTSFASHMRCKVFVSLYLINGLEAAPCHVDTTHTSTLDRQEYKLFAFVLRSRILFGFALALPCLAWVAIYIISICKIHSEKRERARKVRSLPRLYIFKIIWTALVLLVGSCAWQFSLALSRFLHFQSNSTRRVAHKIKIKIPPRKKIT